VDEIMSEKRNALLDTATRLFSQFGFHAVGIDRIILESGVAKMTMYKHFPSKSQLVIDVLSEHRDACAASLAALVGKQREPLDKLRAVFVWHDRRFKAADFHGCLFLNAAAEFHQHDEAVMRVAVERRRDLTDYIASLIAEMTDKRSATRLAKQCLLLIDGATVAAHVSGRTGAAMEAWDIARDLVTVATGPVRN
jgi:AcrR family transcriptional regulator